MKFNLLTSLRKYKVSANRDPIENFITEAFAWLLICHEGFSVYFLNELKKIINSDILIPSSFNWSTQQNFNGVFPDMVCEFNDNAFVFEHKAWSYLHENQLNNYREYANNKYSTYYIILITAHAKQHEQSPDLALCWYDIFRMIDDWLSNKDLDEYFMFVSFKNLLINEGMGPAAPISHNSILSYYSARHFIKNTIDFIKRVFYNREVFFQDLFKNEKDFEFSNRGNEWGRIGLSLLNTWRPGIFIGFLIDGEDHATKSILGEQSPDFSVILSFDSALHAIYPENINYISLCKYLETEINKLGDGWQFYEHIKDELVEDKNYWHPIHIRKPMLELFRGTSKAEEQENKFIEASKLILEIILNSESYQLLKNDLSDY